MKHIRTKRNIDAEQSAKDNEGGAVTFSRDAQGVAIKHTARDNPIADQYKVKEAQEMDAKDAKKSHLPLYTLLVCCAIFLSMVYMIAQLNTKIDNLEAKVMLGGDRLAVDMVMTGDYFLNESMPFCYGYDQNGQKGYAVDGRKIKTPCEGVVEK